AHELHKLDFVISGGKDIIMPKALENEHKSGRPGGGVGRCRKFGHAELQAEKGGPAGPPFSFAELSRFRGVFKATEP
ncbi:hypothetical protein, partial [Novosphingobium sp. fls2-241-R2A-195]|uniref:hypothetical protein n=1 Tax=Novosphingobium sp. fls2-241-R2A-195 TaxID=3040296 RepID=UPI00254BB02F